MEKTVDELKRELEELKESEKKDREMRSLKSEIDMIKKRQKPVGTAKKIFGALGRSIRYTGKALASERTKKVSRGLGSSAMQVANAIP